MTHVTKNGTEGVPVGELCSLVNGRAFKPTEWGASGLPIIRIQNLNDETRVFNYYDGPYDKKHEVNPGDLLFSWSGTPGTSFGAFFWSRQTGVLNQHIFNVHVDRSRVEKRYFRYALNHRLIDIIGQAHGGVGLKHITKGKLEAIGIPLPPLSEQKRIADILDKADAIRRKRQEASDEFGLLTAAAFNDMFSKKMTTAQWSDLSEYLVELRYGTSNKSGDGGYTTLRIPNIVRSIIDLSDLKTVDVSESEFEKLRLIEGDVLFVRTNGNPDYVGRCAVFNAEQFDVAGHAASEIIYASYLIRARLQSDRLRPVFLQSLLQTAAGRKNVREKCRTSAGQYNINTKGLGSLQIPDIKIDEQIEFESRVASLRTGLAKLTTAQADADDLFNSLVQRAFKGEL